MNSQKPAADDAAALILAHEILYEIGICRRPETLLLGWRCVLTEPEPTRPLISPMP